MNKLLIAALLPLACLASACVNMSPAQVSGAVIGAIATETAAAQRCPRNNTERAVLASGRVVFDIQVGPFLSPFQRDAVDQARIRTDLACPGVRAATEEAAKHPDEAMSPG
jgi:hypothetical protein